MWTSSTFYKLRNTLNIKLDRLDDFRGIADSPALHSLKSTLVNWGEFGLFIAKRIDKLFVEMKEAEGGPLDSETFNEIAKLIRFCSEKITRYWVNRNGTTATMYDMEGIQTVVARLHSIEERLNFLNNVLVEMALPIRCEIVNGGGGIIDDVGKPRFPRIVLVWHHALSSVEYQRLQAMADELQTYVDEGFRRKVFSQDEASEARMPGDNHAAEIVGEGRPPKLLSWESTQADLIYIMDRLIEAGLLQATSAEI
ncbi:MAG: hypothetical protein ABI876_14750, partial [Bacteroidota bacterium]